MMNDRRKMEQAPQDPVGLCRRCAHAQIVASSRGSRFYLCRLSYTNPAFPRYPPLPVVQCTGFVASDTDPVVR
jgi:hypothetical protein